MVYAFDHGRCRGCSATRERDARQVRRRELQKKAYRLLPAWRKEGGHRIAPSGASRRYLDLSLLQTQETAEAA